MRRRHTNRVIFHHSLSDSATVEEIRQWHLDRGFSDIGYHYVIDRDGTTHHGRDEREIGAHAMGKNHDSVGVCLVGDFRKYEPLPEQIASAADLYHCICRGHGKSLGVEFHREHENPCPGPKLNRDDFREIVLRNDPFHPWSDAG